MEALNVAIPRTAAPWPARPFARNAGKIMAQARLGTCTVAANDAVPNAPAEARDGSSGTSFFVGCFWASVFSVALYVVVGFVLVA